MDNELNQQLQDKIKKVKVELEIGISDLKISIDNFKEFEEFIMKINKENPSIDKFYYKLNNNDVLYVDLDTYYDEIKVKKLKVEGQKGIIHKDTPISEEKIVTDYSKVLKIEKINQVIHNVFDSSYKIKENKEEFFENVKKNLLKRNKKITMDYTREKEHIKHFLKEFFDYEYKESEINQDKIISKVFEKDNIRYVLVRENQNHYNLILANTQYDYYNYLDVGRKIEIEDKYYSDEVKKVFIFDFETLRVDINMFLNGSCSKKYKNGGYISDEELLKNIQAEKRKQQIENLKEKEEEDIKNGLKKQLDTKGFVVINGIKRIDDGFCEYENQRIGYKGFSIRQVGEDERDFNEIFDKMVFNYDNRNSKENVKLSCGSFEILMEDKGNCRYVEDIRINKGEVEDVLKKAICYNNKLDYIKFLNEVSRCSIAIHEVLSNGLRLDLNGTRYNRDNSIWTKINVIRKKNLNYISHNETDYLISNINRLMECRNNDYRDFNSFVLTERLEKNTALTYDLAIEVIKEGLKEYKDSIKKAQQLLSETIKVLKVKEVDLEHEEHNGKGYVVKGKSGKEYFVTEDLKIYEYPIMRYICVINKSGLQLNKLDLLVSRLYALSNDNQTGKLIYTLER